MPPRKKHKGGAKSNRPHSSQRGNLKVAAPAVVDSDDDEANAKEEGEGKMDEEGQPERDGDAGNVATHSFSYTDKQKTHRTNTFFSRLHPT